MFARGSRYETVPDAVFQNGSGREIVYKRLRLIPDPPSLQVYKVVAGDRLDLIAFRFYQDPEQFWRICDANRAVLPEELTREVGRRLRIPLAQR
jgi:nucleoid-associated protein YgaU